MKKLIIYWTISLIVLLSLVLVVGCQQQPVDEESENVRHLLLSRPVKIKIDGRSRQGVVLKPR